MSKTAVRLLLLVEDNPGDARLLREMLNDQGSHDTELTHVECMCEAEKHLAEQAVDIILLDLGLPDAQGLGAVRRAHAAAPRVPLVVLTGLDDESLAVQALQEGAQDYLIKGQIETRGLLRALRYAIERKSMEERNRSLMEHANDAILLLLPGLRILEANRRAEELLGCPREQIVGRSYESFIPPEDRSVLAADRASLLAEGATRVQDRRLLRADGSVVSVDVSASLIRIGDEAVVLSILHDTTERKRTERELRAARNRLHHLVSENPAVIYALRIEGEALTLTWISENVERLLGNTVEEVLSREWWMDRLHPDERATVLADLAVGIVSGRLIQEYRFRHRDGTYLWLRDEKRVLRDVAGQPTEVVGSWSDITLRKSAERRLLESEEEYRLLFDSNPHPMWVFDVETLAFLAVNDAAVQLYGFSRDEFLGMTITEIRALEEVTSLLEYLATIPGSPSLPATQVKHRKKDGSLIEVAGASNAIEFHGRRARLVLANDVTENKRLEAQLLQAQRMEAVGRLAGGVAHDFNNALGVIQGYTELLMRQAGEAQRGKLEQILEATRRASGLTRQLLAFSRKQIVDPKVLDLNALLSDVEKMLERLIGEDIDLAIVPGADLGQVKADPGQLEQVVMNLCVNARDAMPDGGLLRIETANAELDKSHATRHEPMTPGRYVMLAVSDTGCGIKKEILSQIFEPFFTTKELGKGTGLGLSMVYGIVKQAGGSVWVYSELGRGTTFKIYLPRVDEPVVAPEVQDTPMPSKGWETILLVEDEGSLRAIAREILEEHGYRVIEAAGVNDVIEIAHRHPEPIHLLLTDVVMPRMNGRALAESLVAERPELRVLYMSGYTDDVIAHSGVLESGTLLLEKPFTTLALLGRVREALGERGTGETA